VRAPTLVIHGAADIYNSFGNHEHLFSRLGNVDRALRVVPRADHPVASFPLPLLASGQLTALTGVVRVGATARCTSTRASARLGGEPSRVSFVNERCIQEQPAK